MHPDQKLTTKDHSKRDEGGKKGTCSKKKAEAKKKKGRTGGALFRGKTEGKHQNEWERIQWLQEKKREDVKKV